MHVPSFSDHPKEALLGWALLLSPVIAFVVLGAVTDDEEPSVRPAPMVSPADVSPSDSWSPDPVVMPTGPVYGPAEDCGDGTYGTPAECWRRGWDQIRKSAAAVPPPTSSALPVYRGTVCRDGWLSSSTGRGTCSHHGGEG